MRVHVYSLILATLFGIAPVIAQVKPQTHDAPIAAPAAIIDPSEAATASSGEDIVAPLNPEFITWRKRVAAHSISEPADIQAGELGNISGYRPSPLDLSYLKGSVFAKSQSFRNGAVSFDAAYDLRSLGQVTEVRNQKPFGTCWAFGAIGSLESSQLKAGRGTFDLSEWHLAYFARNNLSPTMVSFTKVLPLFSGTDETFDQGGVSLMSTAILARGTGAVDEVDAPYQYALTYPITSLPKGTEPTSVPLQQVIFLGSSFATDDIKTALINYGAVSVMFPWHSYHYSTNNATYRYASPDPDFPGVGHYVDIVGWDDDFPATKFPYIFKPNTNGAWIVRNSWGNTWGKSGYFYMSYDTLTYDAAVFVSGDTDYPRIYQYDPLGWVESVGNGTDTAWFSNVFTAQLNEQIQAVSFYAPVPGASYTISVRTNVSGDPSTGTLKLLDSDTLDVPGYRMVTLPSPVQVAAGTKFAVIVKLTTPGYHTPIAYECPISSYSDRATASPGQSYRSYNGNSWVDLTSIIPKANVCLKAFGTAITPTINSLCPITSGKSGLTASVPSQAGCACTWGIANGTITSGSKTNSITFSAGSVGATTLTCTVSSSGGASVTVSKDIPVISAPESFTIMAASVVTTLDTNLTASVPVQDDCTYAWTLTDGSITKGQGTNALTYAVGTPGTLTLKCVVTNGAGTAVSVTKALTVVAKPDATLTAAHPVTTGKTGLTASVPIQAGCSFDWSLSGGTITSVANTSTSHTIIYTAGGVGTAAVTIHVTNAAGAVATATQNIDVIAPPDGTITANIVAFAGQMGLTATVPEGQTNCTYTWTLTNGALTSGIGTRSITYKAGTTGTATLKCVVKNAAGTLATGTQSVQVVANKTTILTATPVTVGTSGLVAAVPQGSVCIWDLMSGTSTGSTITAGSGTSAITYTAGTAGTFTLRCLVNGVPATKVVNAVAAPDATITLTGGKDGKVTTGQTGMKASVPTQAGSSYAWSLTGGTITAGAGTPCLTFTAGDLGTAMLKCVVKNAAGMVVAGSRTVEVVEKPLALFSLNPISAYTSSNWVSVPPQLGMHYAWSLIPGTSTGSSIDTVDSWKTTLTAGTVGTVTVACAVTNAAGTSVTGTKTVTVLAKPVADIGVVRWSTQRFNPPAVTVGETCLCAFVPNQSGCNYTWTVPGGTIIGDPDAHQIDFTPPVTPGPLILSCIVTSTGGSHPSTTGTKTLTVVAAPDATIAALDRVTQGKTGLAASVSAGQTGCKYTWAVTNGKITTGAGTRAITYTGGTVGTATLSCVVKNAADASITGTKNVIVVPVPEVAITAASPVQAGATGLVASVPDAGEGASYLWTVTGGTAPSGILNERTLIYTAGAPGTLTLKCVVTRGGTAVSGTKSITVQVAPVGAILAPSPVTAGATGLAASVPDAGVGATYAWTLNGNPIATSDCQITFTAPAAGMATLGCMVTPSGAPAFYGYKTLTVVPAPAATISVTKTTVSRGQTGLTASVLAQTGCTFAWTLTGGTITAGQGTRTLTYTAGGVGTLTLGCMVTNTARDADADTQDITVIARPIVTITAAAKVITLTGSLAASVPLQDGCGYAWIVTGGTVTSGQGTNAIEYAAGAVGMATLKCVVTNAAGTAVTGTKIITVVPSAGITITTQPQNQISPAGGPVTFTVGATSTVPLHFQWRKDGLNVGTDSASCTIASAHSADEGTYTVIVGNGIDSVSSNPAVLTVNLPTISGNAGMANVTLSYDDGGPKSATSASDGSYTLVVPEAWSGTVTPSAAGYAFNPGNHAYADVTCNQTGQDYATAVAATLNITISGLPDGVDGNVRVYGPSSYEHTVTTTENLTGLFPDIYTIAPAGVWGTGAHAGQVYQASGVQAITLIAGNTSNVTITYTTTPSMTFQIPDMTHPGHTIPLDLTAIPGGTFTMGSSNLGDNWSQPLHSVTVSDFSMAKVETTQAQWVAVMGSNPSNFTGDLARPVECVSYNDITQVNGFLDQLNAATSATRPTGLVFRLPTEAEWEYACRAGSTTAFYFGDDVTQLGAYAWYSDNSGNATHPVGTKTPNAWGLYDMTGNADEWCQDWFGTYGSAPQTDPAGPSNGSNKIFRGGAWIDDSYYCSLAKRFQTTPNYHGWAVGFRVVLAPTRTP
jgi:C1A family cysteine protease/formylglycine-generating enzyme required for sulfatase activity